MMYKPEYRAPSSPHQGRVKIEDLLGDAKELVIVHNGREYHLRITRNDKLILTA